MPKRFYVYATIILTALIGYSLLMVANDPKNSKPPPSQLEIILRLDEVERKAQDALLSGCIARGLRDPNLAQVVLQSRGQFCGQALAQLQSKIYMGLYAACVKTDEKCMFTAGYATTYMGYSIEPLTESDLPAFEKQIEADFAAWDQKRHQNQ